MIIAYIREFLNTSKLHVQQESSHGHHFFYLKENVTYDNRFLYEFWIFIIVSVTFSDFLNHETFLFSCRSCGDGLTNFLVNKEASVIIVQTAV